MIADWHEDAHMVAESYPWGAHRIVHSETTNVHCSCTTLYVNCECSRGSGRVYVTGVVENVTEYKCYHNDRILIRQPVPVSTSTLTTTAGGVVLGDGVNVTTLLTCRDRYDNVELRSLHFEQHSHHSSRSHFDHPGQSQHSSSPCLSQIIARCNRRFRQNPPEFVSFPLPSIDSLPGLQLQVLISWCLEKLYLSFC